MSRHPWSRSPSSTARRSLTRSVLRWMAGYEIEPYAAVMRRFGFELVWPCWCGRFGRGCRPLCEL